jgi:CDP-diacylglycerol--glycerol-3-phosphate 3-phosphatidyltransferase
LDIAVLDNAHARQVIAKSVDPVAHALVKMKITPDAVTWAGAIGNLIVSVAFLAHGHFLLGGLLILVLSVTDLLDGTMARLLNKQSPWGAFLDSTLDRVSDASLICAVIYFYAQIDTATADKAMVAGLVALIMGQLTSYARARAEGLGVDCKVGIAERAERSIILLTGILVTGLGINVLPTCLWLLAVVTTITVGQRIWHVRKLLAS